MKNLLFSLICLLLLNYSSRAQDNNYSFTEFFKITEPAQLIISSDDGNIEVLPSNQDHIEVFYIVKKNNKLLKINRAELKKELSLEVTSNANSLKINIEYPKNLRRFEANNGITLSLKIYVPKQTACNLKTGDGNISLTGLVSDQNLKTGDGNIQASKIKGSVKGSASDGNILAKEIGGSVDFKIGDGNVSLEDIVGNAFSSTGDGNMKAIRIKGDLSLKTSDGDIEFDGTERSVTATTNDGNIKGNVIELQRRLLVEAGDGNIEVTIPDRLGLDLDIRGNSIHAPLKNFSGKSGQHLIQGSLNGGGIKVELKSTEGNIKLSYR